MEELDNLKGSEFYNSWKKRFDKLSHLGNDAVLALPNTTFDEWIYYFKRWSELFSDDYEEFKSLTDEVIKKMGEEYDRLDPLLESFKSRFEVMESKIAEEGLVTKEEMEEYKQKVSGDLGRFESTQTKNFSDFVTGQGNAMTAFQNTVTQTQTDGLDEMRDIVNNRVAQLANGVRAYPNSAAIKAAYPNGAQGIFIAVDTGHQWYYVNGQWRDGGTYQAVGIDPTLQADIDSAVIGKGLYKTYESVPTELRLFDKVPNNTIISFDFDVSQYPSMHAPENAGKGALVTLSYSDHKHVTSGGKFQLFNDLNNRMWSRVCWTGDNTFKPWVSLNRQDPAITQPIDEQFTQNNPVYADLNTVPTGTYTYYSDSYVENTPEISINNGNYGFTVSTFDYRFGVDAEKNGNQAGRMQILVTQYGLMLSRVSWGQTVSYTDWEVLNTSSGFNITYDSETDEITYKEINNFKGNYDLRSAAQLQPQSVVTYPYNGPKNGTGAGTYVTYNGITGMGGKAQFAFKSNGDLYYRIFWGGNQVSEDKAWLKLKIDEPAASQTPAYLSLFEKVAVIGDSYASGEIYDKDGHNQHGDQYNHSWLAILSRKYGFNYYNYSRGGQTAHGWMTETTRAHGEFTTDNKHYDFYFLNLGINDHDRNPADYAGVKADVANGTNSFYGEYGRIIETIKAKDPKAPIAIATITRSFGDGNHKRYNDVIRALASDYNLILIDFGDNITIDNIKSIVKRGGHPDAVGYAKLAQAFDDGLNNAIKEQGTTVDNLKYLFS